MVNYTFTYKSPFRTYNDSGVAFVTRSVSFKEKNDIAAIYWIKGFIKEPWNIKDKTYYREFISLTKEIEVLIPAGVLA